LCSHGVGHAGSYAPHMRMRNVIIGKQESELSEAFSVMPVVYSFTVYTSTYVFMQVI